jgi:hypothetical protein
MLTDGRQLKTEILVNSFSEAAAENGESRIYAGIYFRSAVEDGIEQGNHIGRFVFKHALQ